MKPKRCLQPGIGSLVLLLAAGLFVSAACGRKTLSEKADEKIVSDMLSKATGGKAQVDLGKGEIKVKTAEGDTVITSGGGTWPGTLPEEIRQFRAGAIVQSTNHRGENGNGWTVVFRDVEPAGVEAYIDDLKSDGWSVMMTTDTGHGNYTQVQMGNYTMTISYSAEEKTLGLSIVESGKE